MTLLEKLKEELTKAQKRVGTGRFAIKGIVMGLERAIEIASQEPAEPQLTVYAFVKKAGLKIGDRVTNGIHTWEITNYTDRGTKTAEFYLKSIGKGPLVAGPSLLVVNIPGLRKAPKQIRVWKWVYQLVGKQPEVTKAYYPDSTALRERLKVEGLDQVLWTKKIEECSDVVEVECEC